MPEVAVLPVKCRYTTYPSGIVTKCHELAILSGYCRAHVPDHIARQHYTRVLVNVVLLAVERVIDEAVHHGRPTPESIDALAVAYVNLTEWRKSS